MRFTSAILRTPGASYAHGLTQSREGPPDFARALTQHEAYGRALRDCGVALTILPAAEAFPDGTFVEDTAILTAQVSVLARPGAATRAGEVEGVAPVLAGRPVRVQRIEPPGTLDGGDVCEAGDHVFIGLSQRTNEDGAQQLATILRGVGYQVSTIDIRSVPGLLHLKTGLAYLGDRRLLLTGSVPESPAFRHYQRIAVPEGESYAANCVRVNDRLLIAACYPNTATLLSGLGYSLLPLEMSEFRKMDGGLSCLSLRS